MKDMKRMQDGVLQGKVMWKEKHFWYTKMILSNIGCLTKQKLLKRMNMQGSYYLQCIFYMKTCMST